MPNPTSGCATQLSELELELWVMRELAVEFREGEQLRVAGPQILDNTLASGRDCRRQELGQVGTTYLEA